MRNRGNPYAYGIRGSAQGPGNFIANGRGSGGGAPNGGGNGCGLPSPEPLPGACTEEGKYCRSHMGGNIIGLLPGATGVILVTPVNATAVAARWLHMAANVSATTPFTPSVAFAVTAIQIKGDNMLANAGPIIGSTWSQFQTYLEVFWNLYILPSNPLSITVVNLEPAGGLTLDVFASVAGDMTKS